jgi:hypothetical protein
MSFNVSEDKVGNVRKTLKPTLSAALARVHEPVRYNPTFKMQILDMVRKVVLEGKSDKEPTLLVGNLAGSFGTCETAPSEEMFYGCARGAVFFIKHRDWMKWFDESHLGSVRNRVRTVHFVGA